VDVALCYPSVLPNRGGCETYIADLARRLARDGHRIHLYASSWEASALPASMHCHRIEPPRGPRWLRPWRFAAACEHAIERERPDVSLGFDKTWGQDILYPQGGLHAATAWHNRLKYRTQFGRTLAKLGKSLEPANWSYRLLEQKQYFGPRRPTIIVNSEMVRRHFEQFLGVPPESIRVLRSAIDPARFAAEDRFKHRHAERKRWGVNSETSVGLFVAMNYRLKGLEPLLRAMPLTKNSRLVVIGHPNFAKYAKLASSLGIQDRVQFLGHRPDPRDAYFAADYLVHPTFYDPCSLVALEALACGLPVITTRYNGASELLDAKCGVVIDDPHDGEELAAAIATVSYDQFRGQAGSAARTAAAKWTFEHHYARLIQILAEHRQLQQAA
jgi:UDP-glucose:(heptosyl)LPS alpha-1,3-glucosyltransferase